MNQVTNLIQFKNLSKEQQAGFDFENYSYEGQDSGHGSENTKFTKILPCGKTKGMAHRVYRLKIEPEKFYYARVKTIPNTRLDTTVKIGSEFSDDFIKACCDFRPATPDEQPKTEEAIPKCKTFVVAFTYRDGAYNYYVNNVKMSKGEVRSLFNDELAK